MPRRPCRNARPIELIIEKSAVLEILSSRRRKCLRIMMAHVNSALLLLRWARNRTILVADSGKSLIGRRLFSGNQSFPRVRRLEFRRCRVAAEKIGSSFCVAPDTPGELGGPGESASHLSALSPSLARGGRRARAEPVPASPPARSGLPFKGARGSASRVSVGPVWRLAS